jgi:flavin reductase (DIM6/NTAB) family NADH-FMN oxidoreductase RutF
VLFCGRNSGRDVDKFPATGFNSVPAQHVRPPIIKECLAYLECRVVQEVEAGDHHLVIAEVLAAYTRPGVLAEDGMYELDRVDPLLHLGSNRFTSAQSETTEPSLL